VNSEEKFYIGNISVTSPTSSISTQKKKKIAKSNASIKTEIVFLYLCIHNYGHLVSQDLILGLLRMLVGIQTTPDNDTK